MEPFIDVSVCLDFHDEQTSKITGLFMKNLTSYALDISIHEGYYHKDENDLLGEKTSFRFYSFYWFKKDKKKLDKVLKEVRKCNYYEIVLIDNEGQIIAERDPITDSNVAFWHLRPTIKCQYVFP